MRISYARDIFRLSLLAALLCLPAAAADFPPLIDTDFGTADKNIAPDDKSPGRVSGVLPAGWADNSAWAKVSVNYQKLSGASDSSAASGGSAAFLRIDIGKSEQGRVQLAYRLPALEDGYFQLAFAARSRTGVRPEWGIRLIDAPYAFLWSVSPAITKDWKTHTFDFRVDKVPAPCGLWINIDGAGELDIKSVRLLRRTREEIVAEQKSQHAAAPKNLLRLSRMPLGLQSGWSIWRELSDGDVVAVDSDESTRGPSGAPALRVKSVSTSLLPTSLISSIPIPQVPVPSIPLLQDDSLEKYVQIYSAPFAVPLATETHTASLYLKGTTKGKVSVVCDGRILAAKNFDFGGERWQRLEVSFKPLLLAKAYGLRIDGAGKFWIDSLQVERGERATEYESQAKCEVALACGFATRVQFVGDDSEIRFSVTGEPTHGILKIKAVNIYGGEEMLPSVQLGRDFWSSGKFSIDGIFRDRPYGPLRFEAWVENKDGERISSYNELVVYRLRRPHYWKKDAPLSPFGTHTLSTNRHIEMAKAIGVNWVRLHDAGTEYIGWYHLERRKGQWSFQDSEINRYRAHYMKILGAFSTAPEWASGISKRRNGYFDRYYEPKRMDDFANYVTTVTKRYKGTIDAYEVWNEPWLPQFWHSGFDAGNANSFGYVASADADARYAELMKTAYQAAKSADKNVKIVGFNTTADGDKWTAGVLAGGGLNACDVISYHHYTSALAGAPGDAIEQGWNQALGPILEKEDGKLPKNVWLTEGSPDSGSVGAGFYKHTLPFENSEDAIDASDRLCRFVVSLLAQNVQKVFLYSMHTHTYFGAKNEWRTLVTEEGYLHPSAAAHSAMAWQLEDTRFQKSAQIADGVTVFFFEGKNRSVAVLSPQPQHAAFVLPRAKDVEYSDLFGNPLEPGEPVGRTLIYITTSGDRLYKLTALLGVK